MSLPRLTKTWKFTHARTLDVDNREAAIEFVDRLRTTLENAGFTVRRSDVIEYRDPGDEHVDPCRFVVCGTMTVRVEGERTYCILRDQPPPRKEKP